MIVDRYYYSQLNKVEKVIYKAFYDGVMAHRDIIPVPVKGNLSQEVFSKIFSALTRDNPLIYYLNQSTCKYVQDAFGRIAICPQYFFTEEKIKEYNKKIQKSVNELAEQLQLTSGSEYEKALKVHDWLCQNVSYDQQGHNLNDPVRVIMAHNIIGVFAHKNAQCEGIAKAVKVLLNAVDVKCIVATGLASGKYENGPHAWNIVNLDGKAYNMDATWDIGAKRMDMSTMPYEYFLLPDEIFLIEHKADGVLPVCNSMEMNYFNVNNVVFDSKWRLIKYLDKTIEMAGTEFYYRAEGKLKHSTSHDAIREYIVKQISNKMKRHVSLQYSLNETTGTCWMKIK